MERIAAARHGPAQDGRNSVNSFAKAFADEAPQASFGQLFGQPASNAKGKTARPPIAAESPEKDAPGASFLLQSRQTQANVLADMKRTGAQNATFNGQPLDSSSTSVAAAPNPSRGPAVPSDVPQPHVGAYAAPAPAPTMWDQVKAGGQAAVNTVASATGGAVGGLYGGWEAVGHNLGQLVSGNTPNMSIDQQMAKRAQQFTPELPKAWQTDLGKQYTQNVGDAAQSLAGVAPLAEVSALAHSSVPGVNQAARKAAGFAGADATAAAPIMPTAGNVAARVLPKLEQTARGQVLSDVGFDKSAASALAGDSKQRAVEFQMGKFDEPAGHAAAQQFAHEAQTLSDYTRGLITKAGGTVGTDQGSLYSRGQTQVRPIQALRDWFDDKASGLYKAADEKAQGQPVSLGGFADALQDPSHWTQPSHVLLKDAASSFAKKTGMTIGEDGSLNGTALQAETVRKYLNSAAKKDTTGSLQSYADTLKGALDDDVGKSAGGPIYDQARQLWALRQRTIADPKGISSLLNEEGTNRAIPFDRVPDNIAKMPQDQFTHIVNTLQNLPPELQHVGNASLGEIKGHFLNSMLDDATTTRGGNGRSFWNGTGVNNVLNNNSGKFSALFSADEMKSVNNLKQAGDILSFDPSYPGAAAQAQNAVKQGLMANMVGHGITATGGGIGTLLGAPVSGTVAGHFIGNKVQNVIAQKQALSNWDKKTVSLKDLLSGSP